MYEEMRKEVKSQEVSINQSDAVSEVTGSLKKLEGVGIRPKYRDAVSEVAGSLKMLEGAGIRPKYRDAVSGVAGLLMLNEQYLKLPSSISGDKKYISKNLVVSQPVINQMHLGQEARSEVKHILGKFSPSTFSIKVEFSDYGTQGMMVDEETNESIPVQELLSTMGTLDIISSLSTKEIVSFYNELIKYPMLGLEHEVGRKIFKALKNSSLTIEKDIVVYRARGRSIEEQEIPYNELQMFTAPFDISGQGRYNVTGQGELYLCDTKGTAINEAVGTIKQEAVDVIKWRLSKEVRLLDLTNKETPLVQHCNFTKKSRSGFEYLVPNFIAQCAKKNGISGIKYVSNRDKKAINYVLFDFQTSWFEMLNFYTIEKKTFI